MPQHFTNSEARDVGNRACSQLETLHNRAAAELRDLITKADAAGSHELGHQATSALCDLGSMWLHIKTLRMLIKDLTP